jgi:uncharacterized protein with ParB-like and HNH nuclease domain
MKADSLKISKVFSSGGDIHYVLPHFQRQYSWDKSNWETLLSDALAIYEEYDPDQVPEHFLGSLVVINDGTRSGVMTAFNLVDGQQRLTTISLLLCAFRDLVKETDPPTGRRIQRMLVNSDDMEGDVHYKLFPTGKYGDRQAYISIINGKKPDNTESTIPQAYDFFYKSLGQMLSQGTIISEDFFVVLTNCFQVVFIELNKDESPYKIFESLNAKGKPLSQADLVRNYIAMRLPTTKQEKVFTEYWGEIESLLQEKRSVGRSRIGELTAFIRHYLAIQSRILCSEQHIYARFRDNGEDCKSDQDFIDEIAKLRRFAVYYSCLLRPQEESRLDIRKALERLNCLEIQTAYPLLLSAYDAFESNEISKDDFLFLLSCLENYFIRRYICASETNSLNKIFPDLWRDICEEIESLKTVSVDQAPAIFQDAVKKALISRGYPSDSVTRQAVKRVKLYNRRSQPKLSLVLETINRHLSKGKGGYTVLDGRPTIEHLMPQTLTQSWKDMIGDDALKVHQEFLHTLGNLTLVTQEWNSALSNSDFVVKKDILSNHALSLNSEYFTQEKLSWDKSAILERADFLCNQLLEIWPSLGEVIVQPQTTWGSPLAIVIKGERLLVPKRTWKHLRVVILEWILTNHPQEFQDVRQQVRIFTDSVDKAKYPKDYYQLSNGVWAYVSASAKQHMTYYRRLLAAVGISEADWEIEQTS